MKKAILLLVMLLTVSFFPSSVHAMSETKYPTANSNVSGVWNNPEYAYAQDVTYTDTGNNYGLNIQNYSGFGFNIPSNAIIENVTLEMGYYVTITVYVGITISNFVMSMSGEWFNGTTGFNLVEIGNSGYLEANSNFYFTGSQIGSTHTNFYPIEVNGMYVLLYGLISWVGDVTTDADVYFYCDYVRLTVAYSTASTPIEEPFTEGIFLGAIVLGAVGLFGFLFLLVKKHT